jgi:hypothetical protein
MLLASIIGSASGIPFHIIDEFDVFQVSAPRRATCRAARLLARIFYSTCPL